MEKMPRRGEALADRGARAAPLDSWITGSLLLQVLADASGWLDHYREVREKNFRRVDALLEGA